MHQVQVTYKDGTVVLHTFTDEAEANEFAQDIFTAMDTSEARETMVEMWGPEYPSLLADGPVGGRHPDEIVVHA